MHTSPGGDANTRAALAWSEELVSYDFGAEHPMAPIRLALTMDLMREFGVTPLFDMVNVPLAGVDALRLIHTPQFIAAVQGAQQSGEPNTPYGLGDEDTPVFEMVHDASARLAGAALVLAELIASGKVRRGFSPAGGMHHAMPSRAQGFCVYNDVALAAAYFRSQGMRVAYIDLDAHHGDGVERALWEDPEAMTISLHQHPATLFPGTGFAQDVGGKESRGSAVNVALPPGTRDAGWLRAIEAVIDPLLAEFAPDVLITQHGADTHLHDPLTHFEVSVDAQRAAALHMADLAERFAGGRWLATGGGGYAVANVVPRSWTHLAAIIAGEPIDVSAPVPEAWRGRAREMTGEVMPEFMGDSADPELSGTIEEDIGAVPQFWQGYDPADDLDRAIYATRQAVFPWHGLDPLTA